MIVVGHEPEVQLIAFAQEWLKCLARADWDSALAMLDEPNSYGIRWTRQKVTDVLHDTFGPTTRFARTKGIPVFSDPDLASGSRRHSFGTTDGGGYWLDYDVPLNGEFSDLTAQFEFHPRASGHAAVLQDLQVL